MGYREVMQSPPGLVCSASALQEGRKSSRGLQGRLTLWAAVLADQQAGSAGGRSRVRVGVGSACPATRSLPTASSPCPQTCCIGQRVSWALVLNNPPCNRHLHTCNHHLHTHCPPPSPGPAKRGPGHIPAPCPSLFSSTELSTDRKRVLNKSRVSFGNPAYAPVYAPGIGRKKAGVQRPRPYPRTLALLQSRLGWSGCPRPPHKESPHIANTRSQINSSLLSPIKAPAYLHGKD